MLIYNAKIFLENSIIDNGYIQIHNGIITEIGHSPCPHSRDGKSFDARGYIIAPGYIDEHIHGAAGYDTMDGDAAGIHMIASQLFKEGVTSFLATTMTMDVPAIERACRMTRDFFPQKDEAEMIGLHLEGPFISSRYAGAQKKEYILRPDTQLLEHWISLSGNRIKMLSYAVEHDESLAFLSFLKKNKITASCGHSGASCSQTLRACQHGLDCLTHFNNAMSKWETRDPGVVTAGLSEHIYVELIADGIHVHPDILKATYRIKGPEQIILITDSNRAKALPDGSYALGGRPFEKKNNICRLSDGGLAGSVLQMDAAVKNMVKYTGCTLHEAVNMATLNPAGNIGISHKKGSIASGKDADLIMLDESGNVLKTIKPPGNIPVRGHFPIPSGRQSD